MKNILLSNDDGIHSKGIWFLKEYFEKYFNVYIVSPDRERSATSHSISLYDPIRLKVIEKDKVYSIDGTPVDSVHVALLGVIKDSIDVVVTGINSGPNLGSDVFYSGTVAAAFQATTFNLPAVAVSIDGSGEGLHLESAAYYAYKVVEKIDTFHIDNRVILNVNVPNLELDAIRGVEITRLGKIRYKDNLIGREDPKGNKYFWIEGGNRGDTLEDGTDVKALHDNKVSITPLRLDITAYDFIERLKNFGFDKL